jgi:hypothetical protein
MALFDFWRTHATAGVPDKNIEMLTVKNNAVLDCVSQWTLNGDVSLNGFDETRLHRDALSC